MRFVPGKLLAGRYRMVALLGCGGMGEVYRAEDLRLGQPVALKFLPDALAQDRETLEGFYAEVRIGRQVAHRNVCRLYDLIEVDGHHALSMEYVDGEDLASLLRRIGRLPEQKGFEVAREICAGLAAARERGVIHRDLKPANVMFDSQGKARITDFGVATLAIDVAAAAGAIHLHGPVVRVAAARGRCWFCWWPVAADGAGTSGRGAHAGGKRAGATGQGHRASVRALSL